MNTTDLPGYTLGLCLVTLTTVRVIFFSSLTVVFLRYNSHAIPFFLNFWLHWVFIASHRLCLVVACKGYCPVAMWWLLLLQSKGSWASVVLARGLSCPAACGILPNQGSNPCSLHRQADSQLLDHLGSPQFFFKYIHRVVQPWHSKFRTFSSPHKETPHPLSRVIFQNCKSYPITPLLYILTGSHCT